MSDHAKPGKDVLGARCGVDRQLESTDEIGRFTLVARNRGGVPRPGFSGGIPAGVAFSRGATVAMSADERFLEGRGRPAGEVSWTLS